MALPIIVPFSAAEVEDTFDKVINADTTPTESSAFMVESGGVYTANQAALTAAAAAQSTADAALPLTGGTLTGALIGTSIKGYRPTSEQTGTTYTFVLGDANTLIYANNASAQTYTIPANASVGLPIGSEIEVFNLGAGIVTFSAAGGVTIYSKDSLLSMSAQYAAAILKKQDDDTWILIGDLA